MIQEENYLNHNGYKTWYLVHGADNTGTPLIVVHGGPSKVNHRTIIKLTDLIQHNATIAEACRYAGISRSTYFYHMRNEVFAEKMAVAKDNQKKVIFSFSTYF